MKVQTVVVKPAAPAETAIQITLTSEEARMLRSVAGQQIGTLFWCSLYSALKKEVY